MNTIDNSRQIKKNGGVSLRSHLETRSKTGEGIERTMPVDADNQSADNFKVKEDLK